MVRIRQYQGNATSNGSATLVDAYANHTLWLTAAHVVSLGTNSPAELDPVNTYTDKRYKGYVVAFDRRIDLALVFSSVGSVPSTMVPIPIYPKPARTAQFVYGEGFGGGNFRRIGGRPVSLTWRMGAIPGHSGGPILTRYGDGAAVVGVISTSNWGDTWPPTITNGPTSDELRVWVSRASWLATDPSGKRYRFTCNVDPSGGVQMQCPQLPRTIPGTIPFGGAPPAVPMDVPPVIDDADPQVLPDEPVYQPPEESNSSLTPRLDSIEQRLSAIESKINDLNLPSEKFESLEKRVSGLEEFAGGDELSQQAAQIDDRLKSVQDELQLLKNTLPKSFVRVAEWSTLKRTVDQMGVRQASISSTLKKIEENSKAIAADMEKFRNSRFRAVPAE